MRLKVLGCSGGIGGELRTTSLLVDADILIDAGTGVGCLSLEELRNIDHVFITHSHLDHIASLPLMVDSVALMRDKPITVYATEATLVALRSHIFNWEIWPDFTRIPNAQTPYMRYEMIKVGKPTDLSGRRITAIPAEHVVPAVGYHLASGAGDLVFSGDTTINDALWEYINKLESLRYLIIETAFSDDEKAIAIASKHLCPTMLAGELEKMRHTPEIYITHLKPGEIEKTMAEIVARVTCGEPRMLENNQVFNF